MTTRLALAALLLAAGAGAAFAADTPRVRVSILRKLPADSPALPAELVPGQRVQGTLLAARPLTLELERGNGDTLAVPRAAIRRFETSVGRRTHFRRGAGIGVVTGVLLGGLFGAAIDPLVEGDGETILKAGAAGGFVGAGLGGVIGAFIQGDRWRATEPPAPPE